jgi:WD40 repeat protein
MVTAVAWSSDSSRLACACDRSVAVFNLAAAPEPQVFTLSEPVWDIAWHPDSDRIAAITFNSGAVETIDLNRQQVVRLMKHPKSGQSLVWLSDGAHLASASSVELRLWSMAERSLAWSVPSGPNGPGSLVRSPDDSVLAIFTDLGLHFVEATTGRRLANLVSLNDGHWLLLSASGGYRGSPGIESELLAVADTEQGHQVLTLQEFATRFGWKNDPQQAVFPISAAR